MLRSAKRQTSGCEPSFQLAKQRPHKAKPDPALCASKSKIQETTLRDHPQFSKSCGKIMSSTYQQCANMLSLYTGKLQPISLKPSGPPGIAQEYPVMSACMFVPILLAEL